MKKIIFDLFRSTIECHGDRAAFDSDHLQTINVTMAFPIERRSKVSCV